MSSRNPARTKREARNERRRRQTRDEIIDAARDVILRDGRSFTLSAVAKELGLTNPALYYYFNSKEALLFELFLREWTGLGAAVEAAVAETETGSDAVEAIIRTVFERYRDQLDVFMLVHGKADLTDATWEPPDLERVRPVNGMLYGGAESRLRADQERGRFPKDRDPRRFAFTAHLAVVGLLNMKAIVESSDDPLIHSDEDLVADLCRTFRDAATTGERS